MAQIRFSDLNTVTPGPQSKIVGLEGGDNVLFDKEILSPTQYPGIEFIGHVIDYNVGWYEAGNTFAYENNLFNFIQFRCDPAMYGQSGIIKVNPNNPDILANFGGFSEGLVEYTVPGGSEVYWCEGNNFAQDGNCTVVPSEVFVLSFSSSPITDLPGYFGSNTIDIILQYDGTSGIYEGLVDFAITETSRYISLKILNDNLIPNGGNYSPPSDLAVTTNGSAYDYIRPKIKVNAGTNVIELYSYPKELP